MKFLKSILIWLLFIPVAILNGALREEILYNAFGNFTAQVISGILLSIGIILISWLLLPKLGKGEVQDYILIGIIWAILTNLFDLIFILVENRPIDDFIAMFDVTTGNLWILVIITLLLTPILVAKKRKMIL